MVTTLEGSSGVETLKVLAGAIGLPTFTVDALAERAGVSRRTVATVLQRYGQAFQQLGPSSPSGPGRPAIRWQVREDHIDDIVRRLDPIQSVVGDHVARSNAPVVDLTDAAVLMAANAIIHAPTDDPATAEALVSAARDSLASAGFAQDGSSLTPQRDEGIERRAELIASVVDVVDASVAGDQERVDQALMRAFPRLQEAMQHVTVDEWMPLAHRMLREPSTVLAAPVLVHEFDPAASKFFPNLELAPAVADVPTGFVCMRDVRAPAPSVFRPSSVVVFDDELASVRRIPFERLGGVQMFIVVSGDPQVLGPVVQLGGKFVLRRDEESTQKEIVHLVNGLAIGLDISSGVLGASRRS